MQTPIMITPELISAKCPVRPSFGHKGTFGRALICAGTPGMGGAAYMAAASALRSGAGLVYVLTEPDLLSPLMTLCPQAIGNRVAVGIQVTVGGRDTSAPRERKRDLLADGVFGIQLQAVALVRIIAEIEETRVEIMDVERIDIQSPALEAQTEIHLG